MLSQIPLPILIVLAALAAWAIVALLFKGEDKLIAERKKCATLNAEMSKYGYTLVAKIFGSLEVGDVAGALKEAESLLNTLTNSTTGPALLQSDLLAQLNAQLSLPNAAPAILKTVAGFVGNPANAAMVKAAGLAIVAAV
jgi:hypothetical protein